MPQRGEIYHHSEFHFKDGQVGRKFFICLNTSDPHKEEPLLIVKVTSQPPKKKAQPGCNPSLRLFLIEAGKDFFPKDTYVQLTDIYEFDAQALLRNHFEKVLSKVGDLSPLTVSQIMNCLKILREDISEKHYSLIFK